jgi:acetoin:2,6-dichlorophenolindophenol oxidoreductase subunit alpha
MEASGIQERKLPAWRNTKMEITKENMIDMYTTMTKIRLFEMRVSELFAAGKIPGFVHLYAGEEAIATGVCANLRDSDYITSTHRGHGHLIAKGGDVKFMMAEVLGKKSGYCKGKGGSMHIADVGLGILGANGIVGAGPPLATGAALACQYQGKDSVCVCFFGDGAANQGTTHEAMNLATCWKLPVVFINENNMYGISSCTKNSMCVPNIADRAGAYDMPGVVVDGNDVMAVHEAASEAIKRARQGQGPTLIECKTYRHRGHFEGDPCVYRQAEELEEWKKKDPIPRFQQRLLDLGVLTEKKIQGIQDTMKKEIAEAERFAEESPYPDTSELTQDVYTTQ